MSNSLFVKTSAERNKHSAVGYLLLIYFVIYAISPLSYTTNKTAEGICAAKRPSDSETNLNIFLLEVICSKMDAKNTDHASSTGRVLTKKIRAILPEDANSIFEPLGLATSFAYISSLSDTSSSGLPVCGNKQNAVCELNPLHSGPAPPHYNLTRIFFYEV